MSPRETSKQRSLRIPLDYVRRADRLSRGKFWLSAAAATCALCWLSGLGWDLREWPRRAERSRALATHGPLAKAHATWETACEVCHVPFTPIDGSAWTARFVDNARASDARCQSCHAGPPHHASESPGDVASCANCHRDHRGRDASLVDMADQNCTRCHASLSDHMKSGLRPSFAASVTRFDADRSHHPEFALFGSGSAKDPGRLKFNHALHMAPGFTLEPGGRPLKALADLPAADRETYRTPRAKDGDPVQLRCDSCHKPDDDGAYLRPVRYERDCRTCHPLDYDPALPAIRHGLQPADVSDALWQSYSALFFKTHPDLPGPDSVPRPVPGRNDRPEVRGAREAIERSVARAARVLYGEKKCGGCHSFEASDGRPILPWTPDGPRPDARVAGPTVPDVWFRHAVFDHSAHRAVGCRDCHAQAYPDAPAASRTSGDVMLPKVAVCQTCHAPRSAVAGGAGYSCTECHRYHHAPPAQGTRALAQNRTADPVRETADKSTVADRNLVAYLRSLISAENTGAVVRRP